MNNLKQPTTQLKTALLLCTGCVLALSIQTATANDASAEIQAENYPDTARYIIRRKGRKVGSHSVVFTKNDAGLSVDVESNITVTILKVPVFKFNYTASELWQDGKLINVEARTNSGGDITNAQYAPSEGEVLAYSSNHWNADVLSASEVFNTLTGKMSQVSIDEIGAETLEDKNTSITANRYRYTGDIKADVWYDESNRWVKLQFKGEDGSTITYTADPLNLNP